MKKTKRFDTGGFTAEQEKWLGGADRTDPFILARMRKAVPDALPPVEDKKFTPVSKPEAAPTPVPINRSEGVPRPLPAPVEAKEDMGDYVPQSSSASTTASKSSAAEVKKVKSPRTGAYDQEGGKAVLDAIKQREKERAANLRASADDVNMAGSKISAAQEKQSSTAPKGSTYRDFKDKIQRTTEDGPSAVETIGKGIGSAASSAASGIGDSFKNYETTGQRLSRERAEAKNAKYRDRFKSGGKVSASSRGDGIAQRGKTRGKMC